MVVEQSIRSLVDLIAALKAGHEGKDGAIWCSGHGQADWALRPSAHRSKEIRESDLVTRFLREAPARHASSPDPSDRTAWLPLMRHYGLPTRLLDWTDSPLVAAYFAVAFERRTGPRAIWLLRPQHVNELAGVEGIPFLTHECVLPLVEQAFGIGPRTSAVLAVSAPQMDLRMALQAARYTIHGSLEALNEHPKADSFLQRLVIPETHAREVRKELALLGVRRSVLFPDLQHLAEELQEDDL